MFIPTNQITIFNHRRVLSSALLGVIALMASLLPIDLVWGANGSGSSTFGQGSSPAPKGSGFLRFLRPARGKLGKVIRKAKNSPSTAPSNGSGLIGRELSTPEILGKPKAFYEQRLQANIARARECQQAVADARRKLDAATSPGDYKARKVELAKLRDELNTCNRRTRLGQHLLKNWDSKTTYYYVQSSERKNYPYVASEADVIKYIKKNWGCIGGSVYFRRTK